MRYGEPIISSAITEVTSHGPRYRGKAAIDLALDRVSFECVCHLLWEGHLPKSSLVWPWEGRKLSPDVVIEALRLRLPPQDVLKLFSFLVLASGLASFGISDPTEGRTIKDAKDLILMLSGCCGFLTANPKFHNPREGVSVAKLLSNALGAQDEVISTILIDATLVLCADMELAPGTFAARVAASAGADVFACLAAGISAHSGELTGLDAKNTEDFLTILSDDELRYKMVSAANRVVPTCGFNYKLFRDGDHRADTLIQLVKTITPRKDPVKRAILLIDYLRDECECYPGISAALVVMSPALELPKLSAVALWCIGRMAGQVAHIMEQRRQDFLMRPRARYVLDPA